MENFKIFWKRLCFKACMRLYDLLAVPIAWYLAFWLRYNLQAFPARFVSYYAVASLCVVILVQMSCYYWFKVYRGLWRFFSIKDLFRIVKASLACICVSAPILHFLSFLPNLPRSILPLYVIMLTSIWSLGRFTRRMIWESKHVDGGAAAIKRVLIIGAGDAGARLIRDLNRSFIYRPVGILDDQTSKLNFEVHGIRVLGTIEELPKIAQKFSVDLIFIALPTVNSIKMRHIVALCEESKVPFRTLPSLSELADGRVEVNALRPVSLDDLLGRDEIKLDWNKITHIVQGKRILVTGGGGSIGSELCRQILRLNPSELILIDHSEYQLYKMEQELLQLNSLVKLRFVLASIVDHVAIEYQFSKYKPEIVFHAAAYKHVPMLEDQIYSAVSNNILGTSVIAEACLRTKTEKMILISTDKAVNPCNVMGASKRIAEIYCQALNFYSSTKFITVRFGNVLGSAGSVVPLFQKQIKAGGPVTVTHPDIERYFMTIPEAATLILQAMAIGKGGEIFVLDMGEPIKIRYLAEQLIKLSGKDVDIVYTGLRPGEKLFEELFHVEERLIETSHFKLHQAIARVSSLEVLAESMQLFKNACARYDSEELQFLMQNLVPEFLLQEI